MFSKILQFFGFGKKSDTATNYDLIRNNPTSRETPPANPRMKVSGGKAPTPPADRRVSDSPRDITNDLMHPLNPLNQNNINQESPRSYSSGNDCDSSSSYSSSSSSYSSSSDSSSSSSSSSGGSCD
jgi:hypothetical protein